MFPVDLTVIIGICTFLILLAGILGGYISLKNTIARSNIEVQTHVRDALKDENELLQARVQRIEAENRRLNDMLQLLITIFEKRGVTIVIDDAMITVRDKDGGTVTVRSQASP